jgi:hypothetical protein
MCRGTVAPLRDCCGLRRHVYTCLFSKQNPAARLIGRRCGRGILAGSPDPSEFERTKFHVRQLFMNRLLIDAGTVDIKAS